MRLVFRHSYFCVISSTEERLCGRFPSTPLVIVLNGEWLLWCSQSSILITSLSGWTLRRMQDASARTFECIEWRRLWAAALDMVAAVHRANCSNFHATQYLSVKEDSVILSSPMPLRNARFMRSTTRPA
jgi:hypothetical protein